MSARDFFRRRVFHNLNLKITALALAAGLWLAVSSSPPSEVAINVAIQPSLHATLVSVRPSTMTDTGHRSAVET